MKVLSISLNGNTIYHVRLNRRLYEIINLKRNKQELEQELERELEREQEQEQEQEQELTLTLPLTLYATPSFDPP